MIKLQSWVHFTVKQEIINHRLTSRFLKFSLLFKFKNFISTADWHDVTLFINSFVQHYYQNNDTNNAKLHKNRANNDENDDKCNTNSDDQRWSQRHKSQGQGQRLDCQGQRLDCQGLGLDCDLTVKAKANVVE